MKDSYSWNEEGDEWLAIKSFLETAERLVNNGKTRINPQFAVKDTLHWLNELLGKDPEGDN